MWFLRNRRRSFKPVRLDGKTTHLILPQNGPSRPVIDWSIRARGSRRFEVDHCIDEDESDMDALRFPIIG